MLERITKRDGTTVPFEPDKIKGAITKAFISARGSDDEDLIDRLTKAVVRLLKVSLKDKPEDTIINVEEVQDAVETTLIKYNLPKVAKEYILFRDCHNKIRKTKDVMINAQTLVGDYIDKLDWRVNENANSGYSYASMLNHISGSVVANYTLSNIYPERIAKAHRDGDFHIHDLSAGIIPYCMGHSLKELLMMGFVGSGGRASSKPAKHLDSALQQISNFMATLQTEAAGAQAFSSWDTYLAPFVRNDGLTYQQVKQAVQQFIFGLNIASRWGQCCKSQCKILSKSKGWVNYENLEIGDEIYVFDPKTESLMFDTVTNITVKPFKGHLHKYTNDRIGFSGSVTPEHRMVYRTGMNSWNIKESKDIIPAKRIKIPVSATLYDVNIEETFTDEFLQLLVCILTDGCIQKPQDKSPMIDIYKSPTRWGCDFIKELLTKMGIEFSVIKEVNKEWNSICERIHLKDCPAVWDVLHHLNYTKKAIPSLLTELNSKQSELVIKLWAKLDGYTITDNKETGNYKCRIQCDNNNIRGSLAEIAIRAGMSCRWVDSLISKNKTTTKFLVIYNEIEREVTGYEDTEEYDGIVWCPTTNTGTIIVKDCDSGHVYITGNCPFTNLTMDLVPPSDLKDMPVIIGGELQDTTYGEYQTEMDMLNKAFIETMIEGDAEGKIFTFPIPTYNIVKDFDWEGDVAKKLFELTCKFGSPYFANYLNSDMNPSDSRSMCPLTPDTKVIVASKLNGIRIVPIGVVYHGYTNKNTEYFTLTPDGWKKAVPVRMELTDVYKITLSNGVEVKMGENHLQPILTEEGIKSIRAKDLDVDTWIPFNKNGYDTDIGSFNLGYAVGAYIGDGSKNDNGIIYSLSSFEKDDITIEKLTLFWHSIGYETKITKSDRHVRFLRVNGSSYDIIKRFVKGVNALTKDITDDVFKMSFDFRAGLVSGFKATDGSEKRNRLYTSSNDLRHSMQMLFASLGKHCLVNYVDNRDSRLGKNENYRIDFPDRQNYGELFKQDDSFNYYRITRIEKVSGKEKWLYCFEVDNQSQLFYLANGMLTHNCRLRLDLKELRRKNGGLFGSGELTGCYDDQTEVLTNNGWKLFKDVLPDDEICTLSSESEIEYHKPIQSFIYDYDGELIHFKSLKSDLMVTPNHRMLYADKHNHKHGFVNAEDYSITKHPIPNKGTWRGGKYSASIFELPAIKSEWKSGNYGSNQIKKWDAIAIDMITWVKFLGLWLSEGSVDNINNATTHGYRVTISQTKEHNLKYIEEILNSMPFKWVYDGKDFIICNKQLWTYMKQFGKQKDRYVPTYVKDLGADYIAAFLDALWLGDGSVHKTSGQSVYYTTSKQLADDVQELLVKAGYQASMHQRKPRISKIGDRTVNSSMICYEVSVRFSAYTYLNDKISKRVPYRGKVYCLEVPNNTMMVRRNGYTLWCGNSVGVCTINMPRIGYLASNKEEFFSKLEYLMVLAKDSLEIKRKIAQANIDNGLLPYTKIYVKSLKNHFSTIGLVGLNEACLNLLGCDLTTPEGQDFGVETLEFMRSKMSEFQEETGNLFNLEGVPAEATAYRLAKIDKEKFGDIITAGTDEVPYYTNSSQIPVGYTDDIFEACDLQDRLQPLYTGGIVQHLYLGERIEDPAQAAKLIKKLCENYKIPYFSLTPTFSICKVHGYIPGNHSECPYDKDDVIEKPAK